MKSPFPPVKVAFPRRQTRRVPADLRLQVSPTIRGNFVVVCRSHPLALAADCALLLQISEERTPGIDQSRMILVQVLARYPASAELIVALFPISWIHE